jgi:hypothetical protein
VARDGYIRDLGVQKRTLRAVFTSQRHVWAQVFTHGNPLVDMASKDAAELQRPYPGLTERRGVGGGSPRFAILFALMPLSGDRLHLNGLSRYPIK